MKKKQQITLMDIFDENMQFLLKKKWDATPLSERLDYYLEWEEAFGGMETPDYFFHKVRLKNRY